MRLYFASLHILTNHINKDQLRKQLLDELLLNADSIPVAVQTVTNINFAKDNFGKDHAAARVYSIALLSHDVPAKRGA